MPGSFDFAPSFGTGNFLSQTTFSSGTGLGIDAPADFWAQGASFHFGNNDVSFVPIALRAGQTLAIDLDFGVGGMDDINPRYTVINVKGTAVASASSSVGLDSGTTVNTDPRGTFTAATTGIYFVAVSHQSNGYINGTYNFNNLGTDGGDFLLNLGLTGLSALVTGTMGHDTVTLGLTEVRYDALDGNDAITASTNGTTIDGGNGDDSLYGNTGSDILCGGRGGDYIYGNDGLDVLAGGLGGDNLFGGTGNDEIAGGDGSDSLYGEDGNDFVAGEDSDDFLQGGANNDTLLGGDDNDYLTGGLGNDRLDGGDGNDIANYSDATGNLNISLLLAGAQVTGMGSDTLISIENLAGGAFRDTLQGDSQNNSLTGYAGNDTLTGNGGFDALYGNDGSDTLNGGAEGDLLFGGGGVDHLTGGTGSDNFYYESASASTAAESDRVYDFSHAEGDRINLASLYSGTLVFLGAGAFTGTAAEVRVTPPASGAFQLVYVDADGNGVADMRILVQSATTLNATDFYL